MKTAIIQLNAGADKVKNVANAVRLVSRAAQNKAQFILLPEMFHFRGPADGKRGYAAAAELIPGPSTEPLMVLAKRCRAAVLAGSICERIPGSRKVYNTSVLIGPRGKILAKYRKQHLFDAIVGTRKVKESQYYDPGTTTVVVKLNTWRVGLSVCFDVRFPELYRSCLAKGAEILCVPSAFTRETGRRHWEVLLRARAIENFCYVLAPNQIGPDGRGILSYGNSLIIDPSGEILARASGDQEEILFAELHMKRVREIRKAFSGAYQRKIKY